MPSFAQEAAAPKALSHPLRVASQAVVCPRHLKTADPQLVGGITVASSGAGGDTAIDPLGAAPQIDGGPLTGLGPFAGSSTLATSFFTSCAATSSLGHGLNTPSGSGPLY